MLHATGRVILILGFMVLSGCAIFRPDFTKPEISVSAFRLLPSNGIPKFEIELQIMNPNSFQLELNGMSYSANIEGHRVVSGVANNIPVIPAYGEGSVRLAGSIDLFSGFQLLTELMQPKHKGINYLLEVKLDIARFLPNMTVEKSGLIAFPQN